MLSQKSKLIIIISGAVVLFALLVVTIFDLWPSRKGVGPGGAEPTTATDLSFLEEKDTPSGQVFDSSNKEEFADFAGAESTRPDESPLEREARQLAEFFTARFGTYSSDSRFANLDDLEGFMAPEMVAWTRQFRAEPIKREGYFSVTTAAGAAERRAFSLENKSAEFNLTVLRTEKAGEKSETYRQRVDVGLRQDASGKWKVASVVWGERVK